MGYIFETGNRELGPNNHRLSCAQNVGKREFFLLFREEEWKLKLPLFTPRSPLLSLAGALKLQASYEKKRGERGATWIFIGAGWAEKQQQRRHRHGRLIGDTEEEEETDEIAAAPDFPYKWE